MNPSINAIASFFDMFRNDYAQTGYMDAIRSCGANDHSAEPSDMLRSLSFLNGYAQACRLACEWMSPAWEAAHIVACAAGTLPLLLEENNRDQIGRVIVSYKAELAVICEKLEAGNADARPLDRWRGA